MTRVRRRRRRRASHARTYSIAWLLAHQPKSIEKHPHYALLLAHYHSSDALARVRFSRRCYSLLQHARIAPENLHHFYRTYRLPADPFFPLFFELKRAYLAERERRREARRQYILESMRALPPPVLGFIKFLGRLEQVHARGRSPVWQRHLFPASKKAADAYHSRDTGDWLAVFRAHLDRLTARYRAPAEAAREKLLACFVLELIPAPPAVDVRRPNARAADARGRAAGISWPAPAEITAAYRRLCKRHHPDHGGDAATFVELARARDVLLDSN